MVRAVNTTPPLVAPDSFLVHATPTQIYTKVFPGLDIYGDGVHYELTATIRKDSFRVACCKDFDYSTANQPTYDTNGDLQRIMYSSMPAWGDFVFEEYVFWKVGFKFDKDLSSTTGDVFVDLQSDATPPGQEPTGSSSPGSGIPATLSTTTTTRIYFIGHTGAPIYPGVIPITAADEVKKFRIQMLNIAAPNGTKVLDDSLLTDFNVLWLDPPAITDTNFFNIVDEWLNTAMSPYGLIDTWDVSLVTDMSGAFSVTRNSNAATFNDDMGSWDTSSVTNMSSMFEGTTAFDQDLSTWRLDAITSGTDLSGCFNNSGLSGQTWDAGDSSGGAANSWYTKATTLDPSNFYTDGASGNNPTGASQPILSQVKLGSGTSWASIKTILVNNSLGYTVYDMKTSATQTGGQDDWYKLSSTGTPLTAAPYLSTGELNNGGNPINGTSILGALILVIDGNDDVIWKINTVGDNANGDGRVYAYNNTNSALSLAVEYITYNSTHFPFVNITGAPTFSASAPINGNSTGQATLENDWYNGLTADADTTTPTSSNERIVDDCRNNLGLKWVFVHDGGATPNYGGMVAAHGSLFSNPVGIWPSYPYPT